MGGAPYGWQIPELISAERGVSSHVFASFDPVLKGRSSLSSLLFLSSRSSIPLLLGLPRKLYLPLPAAILVVTNNSQHLAHNGAYIEQRARIADYYVDCVSPAAISDIESEKLWTLSAKAVGL